MPLFVVLADGVELDAALDGADQRRDPGGPVAAPRSRWIVAVPAVPRTLTGKKMEVPVKRLLLGRPLAEVRPQARYDGRSAGPRAAFEDYTQPGRRVELV